MKKILIIDDSITFRKGLSQIFKDIYPDCEISEEDNGKDGFHALTRNSFDCICTDLEMEGSDGRAFLEKLMGNKILSKKTVIILSGCITSELVDRFKSKPNIKFIDKSTLAVMRDKIEAYLTKV